MVEDQEELVKSQARILAALQNRPYEQVYHEMRERVRKSAADYRSQMLAELTAQRKQERKGDRN